MKEVSHDPSCAFNIVRNRNLLVPWYLMTCYAYYVEDTPLISDALFDSICQRLHDEWDLVVHAHKHLIDKEALVSGTGFQIKEEDYPSMVKGAVSHLRRTESNEKGKRRKKGASSDRT